MNKLVLTLAIAAAGFGSQAVLAESAPVQSLTETTTVWQVDMSGRPPFKRERVEVPVVDTAQLIVTGEPMETVTVWQLDRSGKPPFRRSRVEVPVVDVAVADVEEVEKGTDFRGRPPFKRHR